ncbi:MAG: STAS domain-containing protein [bacterium]
MTNKTSTISNQFPVIQLWENILAVPIVGDMDGDRTRDLMEKLLRRTRETGAKVVIMDLSGVSMMDTDVSKRLLDLQEAVRLMGAEYMVSGIQPDQTHSLVDLGIDLGSVETHHDLSSALESALETVGLQITPGGGSKQ